MTTMTIPKTFRASDDLIVLSRREYESLKARVIPEFTPIKTDLLALARARKSFRAGKTISLAQLKSELEADFCGSEASAKPQYARMLAHHKK